METLTGQLLIAGPSLWDPNFRRTVLLVGHHDEDGAVGVILNRASDTTAPHHRASVRSNRSS